MLTHRSVLFLVALLATTGLFAAACGSDDDSPVDGPPADNSPGGTDSGASTPEPTEHPSSFSVTIESAGGTWTLDSAPQRIVSLSPTGDGDPVRHRCGPAGRGGGQLVDPPARGRR